jgi:hypothetical protein
MKTVALVAVSFAAAGAVLLVINFLRGPPIDPRAAAIDPRRATQIIVQWPDADVGLWRLWMLERRLEQNAGGDYRVDGHDIGAGTANIFLYASDPDSAVQRVIELHDQGRLQSGMRIGVAENYNADH